jgi:hypothetical protein
LLAYIATPYSDHEYLDENEEGAGAADELGCCSGELSDIFRLDVSVWSTKSNEVKSKIPVGRSGSVTS